MSRKNRNHIDIKKSLEVLTDGYGLYAKEFNFYQFRIKSEETQDIFWDWYHTTGSLVKTQNGYCKGMGQYMTAEDVAIFITKIKS